MPQKPEILAATTIASSRLFRIEALSLRFSNGVERQFERLQGHGRHKGAVMILPFLDEERFVLIREYAAGIDRYELGFPKGLVERDETLLEAANREMMEEIGMGAKRLQVVKELATSPGYLGSHMTLILAQDLYENKLVGDEPEPIETEIWSLNHLDALLAREDVTDARTIAAFFLAQRLMNGQMHAHD